MMCVGLPPERHYPQRQTTDPDVRAALDKFAGGESGKGK